MHTRTIKNISQRAQLGVEPGQEGQVEISQDEEDRMVDRGAIEVIGDADETAGQVEKEKSPEQVELEKQAAEQAQKTDTGRKGR